MNNIRFSSALFLTVAIGFSAPAHADSHDPYEPYNRFMYGINDGLDRTVITPVARGYQKITPKPVRTGVTNFFDNLRDVVSIGSNLLRLDIEKASTDLVRVGINTTFGLGGLINIADAAQMPNNKNSLGDTFATWGWKNSNYFVYPITGPSTVRDAVGDTVVRVYSLEGALIDSTSTRLALGVLNGIDKRAQLLVYTDGLDMAAVDRYAYTRDVFMNMRSHQVGGDSPTADYDNTNIDDLVPAETEPSNAALPEEGVQATPADDTSALKPIDHTTDVQDAHAAADLLTSTPDITVSIDSEATPNDTLVWAE